MQRYGGSEVDLLFLHDFCVPEGCGARAAATPVSAHFVRGYGFATHAYFVSRRYIESRSGRRGLPQPDGNHLDVCLTIDRRHALFSDRAFYARREGFRQEDESPSDNFSNPVDEWRSVIQAGLGTRLINVNNIFQILLRVLRYLKEGCGLDDRDVRDVALNMHRIWCAGGGYTAT